MTKENKKLQIGLGVAILAIILVVGMARLFLFPGTYNLRGSSFSNQGSEQGTNTTKVIGWQDAAKHYGEFWTVEGTIVTTHNSGKACFLNFHPNWKEHFTAVIFANRFSQFPPNPERYYQSKKVQVTGYIKEYRGKPEIIVESPVQIRFLD